MQLMIAIPCYGGMMSSETAGGLYQTGLSLKTAGVRTQLVLVKDESYIPLGRTRIAYEFLQSACTHLLCIDADIVFTPQDVAKLINLNVDFAVGAYPVKDPKEVRFNYKLSADQQIVTRKNIYQVDRIGAGFNLLKRSVFEEIRLKNENLNMILTPKHWGQRWTHTPHYYETFVDKKSEEVITEDFALCTRWREIGGKIFMDTSIKLGHVGSYVYNP